MILAFFPKAGVAIFFMNDIVQSENYFTKVPLFFAKRVYMNVYDRATPSKVLEEKKLVLIYSSAIAIEVSLQSRSNSNIRCSN